MSGLDAQNLSGVAETLLIPLYIRALEFQRPDALLKDEQAVALVAQMPSAFARVKQIRMDDDDRFALILRNREFDRIVRSFLARVPQAIVVHLGCGLDARFERLDDGRVEWYDLDLPEVIAVHRRLAGEACARHHFLACSMFDPGWQDALAVQGLRPGLFLAEGVFMYFEEARLKELVRGLCARFPGAELACDALQPFMVWANNLRLRLSRGGVAARYRWGLRRGADLESWAAGLRLLDEWHVFDRPEPRLAHLQWMRHIPGLARVIGVYHYRLGSLPG